MNVIAWKKTHLCSKLAWIAICAKHLGTTAVHFRRGKKKILESKSSQIFELDSDLHVKS